MYYIRKGESQQNQKIMKEIDKEHIKHPTKGVIGMKDYLEQNSLIVGERRVRRLMHLMNIHAIYPTRPKQIGCV